MNVYDAEGRQHAEKDDHGRHHIESEEVDEMEEKRMALGTKLGISPVLVVEAMEGDRPVIGESDSPEPDCQQKQQSGSGIASLSHSPEGKNRRRSNAPIGIVERDVPVDQSKYPDIDSCCRISHEECPIGMHQT